MYEGGYCNVVAYSCLQVSALELDIIEVDPETKEMLKTLVRWCFPRYLSCDIICYI